MPTADGLWTEAQLMGISHYNAELRDYFSPPTSLLENSQRAELSKIVAEAFGTAERNVRTWFGKNQRQTPFLRINLPDDVFQARVILAKCLLSVPYMEWDDRIERVLVKGITYNPNGVPLRPLLFEEFFYNEHFRWEYNAHDWNPNEGITAEEINSFHLVWYYGFAHIPEWLPKHLRPIPDLDGNPFGNP